MEKKWNLRPLKLTKQWSAHWLVSMICLFYGQHCPPPPRTWLRTVPAWCLWCSRTRWRRCPGPTSGPSPSSSCYSASASTASSPPSRSSSPPSRQVERNRFFLTNIFIDDKCRLFMPCLNHWELREYWVSSADVWNVATRKINGAVWL